MNFQGIHYISQSFIKPKNAPEAAKQPIYLSVWDLPMACINYIQKGLLFAKPPAFDRENQMKDLLEKLKDSLSCTLDHFYPLAGRLATLKLENPPIYSIYVDCANGPGARLIHASLDSTLDDILSPIHVPEIVQSFFDHDRAINHDGHTLSLLTIQVTELIDGIFIGCSINHLIVDGSSFWHFFSTWSEIFNAKGQTIDISRPPIHQRWFPEGHGPILSLPYTHHDQFIRRREAPKLRDRIFHFSADSLRKLKAKANAESNTTQISSLQALSAHVWRCITRTRNVPTDHETICRMAISDRTRLNPPVSQGYVGNCVQTARAVATAGELLERGLGWSAWKLHQAVHNHTDEIVREWIESWLKSPFIHQFDQHIRPYTITLGGSPWFDLYGNEFGLGKAVAFRSGSGNKFDGKVSFNPGIGGGSMDLEICLAPYSMSLLESDKEFMETISLSSSKD